MSVFLLLLLHLLLPPPSACLLIQDQSGDEAAFAGVEKSSAAAADHQDTAHAFKVPSSQLRCGGSGVTQASYAKNTSVLNAGSVRYTVRAPTNASAPWKMRLTILTMPYRSATNFHGVWPVDDATGAIQSKGRVYRFEHTFPPYTLPPRPTCGPALAKPVAACFRPSSPETRECFTTATADQSACAMPHADTIRADPGGRGMLVGAKDVLALVDHALSAVLKVTDVPSVDFPRVLAKVPADGSTGSEDGDAALLFCGTGRGRPHCSLRSVDTLELHASDEPGWVASGAVPRTPTASYGVLVQGRGMYAAGHQVPLPTDARTAANVISLSMLDDTDSWSYRYREASGTVGSTDNGLHRSTSIDVDIDRPWLEQPEDPSSAAAMHQKSTFTKPWSKEPSDGYVYFGVSEYDPGSKSVKSRIARVCGEESAPPDANNFASFLKMEVSCGGGIFELDAIQITAQANAAAAAGNGNARLYLAFQTAESLASSSDRPGAIVCAFDYAAKPYGVDYEMNGLVDIELNQKSFFSKVSGDPFTCTRSADDARTLVYVNPEQHADGYKGKAHSADVVLESVGISASFLHLATYTSVVDENGGAVEILWALERAGMARKVAMVDGAAVEVLSFDTGIVDATSFAVDPASSSVFVGGDIGISRFRSEHCSRQTTCRDCAMLGDPDCGWCSTTSTCGVRTGCAAPGQNWKLDLESRTGAQFCRTSPKAATFQVETATATTIVLSISDPGAAADEYAQPTYAAFVDETRTPLVAAGTMYTVENLHPFTSYAIAIESVNAGGRAITMPAEEVTTDTAAPAQIDVPPKATATSTANVTLEWTAPSKPNGNVVSYRVLRDGIRVCCTHPDTRFIDSGLNPYTRYNYSVAAETRNNDGVVLVGPATNTTSATTFESVPGAPLQPTAVNTNRTRVTVVWSPPDDANGVLTGYAVYVNGSVVSEGAPANMSTTQTLRGLAPHTWYSIAVQAFTSKGAGRVGDALMVLTLEDVPGPPNAPTATLASAASRPTTAVVTWGPPDVLPASAVHRYSLRRMLPQPDKHGIVTLTDATSDGPSWVEVYNGSGTRFNDTGLEPCAMYFYDVTAYTQAGAGLPSSPATVRTGAKRPFSAPDPPALKGFEDGIATAVVVWDVTNACDAASFNVKHLEAAPGTAAGPPLATTVCCDGVQSEARITDLVPGSTHYITLQSVHADGTESPESHTLEINVPEVCTSTTTSTSTTMVGVPTTTASGGSTAASAVESTSSAAASPTPEDVGESNGKGCESSTDARDDGSSSANLAASLSSNGTESSLLQASTSCQVPIVAAAIVGGIGGVFLLISLVLCARKTRSQSVSLTVLSPNGSDQDSSTRLSGTQRLSGPIGNSWEEGAQRDDPVVSIDGIGDYLTVGGADDDNDDRSSSIAGSASRPSSGASSSSSPAFRPNSLLEDDAATSAKLRDAMLAHSASNLLSETSFAFAEISRDQQGRATTPL